jgi:hypothetical protein
VHQQQKQPGHLRQAQFVGVEHFLFLALAGAGGNQDRPVAF